MSEYRPTINGKIQDFRSQYSSVEEYKKASTQAGNEYRRAIQARKQNSSFSGIRPLNTIPNPSNKPSAQHKTVIGHDEFVAKRSSLIPRRDPKSKVAGLPHRDCRPGQGLNRDPFQRRPARTGSSGQIQNNRTYSTFRFY